jgi:hypothetical protein
MCEVLVVRTQGSKTTEGHNNHAGECKCCVGAAAAAACGTIAPL